MNKYEEALNNLLGQDSDYYANDEDVKIIHEAIRKANKYDEKEKPKKVIEATAYGTTRASKCPICNKRYSRAHKKEYCSNCGQKLDWKD